MVNARASKKAPPKQQKKNVTIGLQDFAAESDAWLSEHTENSSFHMTAVKHVAGDLAAQNKCWY